MVYVILRTSLAPMVWNRDIVSMYSEMLYANINNYITQAKHLALGCCIYKNSRVMACSTKIWLPHPNATPWILPWADVKHPAQFYYPGLLGKGNDGVWEGRQSRLWTVSGDREPGGRVEGCLGPSSQTTILLEVSSADLRDMVLACFLPWGPGPSISG